MNDLQDILSILGHVIRAIGFLVLGFGLGKFTLDSYKKGVWQVQIALSVGFFALLVGLTNYASAGSMGTFALGAGAAFLMASGLKIKVDGEEEQEKK